MIARTLVRVAALVAAAGPLAVSAQQKGNVELSGFGRYSVIHPDRNVENGLGIGGGIGVYFSSRFKLAADASYTPTSAEISGADVAYTPFHVRLVYELPLSPAVRALLGTGYVYNDYGEAGRDNGIAMLYGLKFKVTDRLSAFTQVAQDWMPPGMNKKIYVFLQPPRQTFTFIHKVDIHHGLEAGLSARFGGGTPALVAITEPVPPAPDRVEPARQQTAPPPATTQTQSQVSEKAADPPAAPERFVTLEPVFFDFDRWDLLPQTREYLVRVAAILRANPEAGVLIEGHTDRRGSDPYNSALALKRANAVRAFLVSQNVEARRLDTASRGKSQPVDAALTEQAYARNRRVEFRLPTETRLREPR